MPSGSQGGWETGRRRQRWPRWSARSTAVTGLFAVAVLAAALGVGRTVVAPIGPSDQAAGTSGSSRTLVPGTTEAETPDDGGTTGSGGYGGYGSGAAEAPSTPPPLPGAPGDPTRPTTRSPRP